MTNNFMDVPEKSISQLQKEIESKLVEFKMQTDKLQTEFERRGGKAEKSAIFVKLNGMVRQKKLFKIKADGGYRFKQR